MLIWKIIFGITMLFYGFCACGIFISCPHFVPKCAQGTGFTINLALAATEIALDITTDLLRKLFAVSFDLNDAYLDPYSKLNSS